MAERMGSRLGRRILFLLAVGSIAAAVTCSIASRAGAAECPNEAIRQQQGSSYLPDCMAYEMVSPPAKLSQAAGNPEISDSGDRVAFKSKAALAGTPQLANPTNDIYVASRVQGTGWSTAPTVPGPEYDIGTSWPRVFSPDLGHWYGMLSTFAQEPLDITRFYEGGLGGGFSPLSALLVPLDSSAPSKGTEELQGSSADLTHFYFTGDSLSRAYLPGDPTPNGTSARRNVYMVSHGVPDSTLTLMARDAAGKVWGGNCGALIGGGSATQSIKAGAINQGAISTNGGRVYMSVRTTQPTNSSSGETIVGSCEASHKLRIVQRLETPTGPQFSELISSECGRVPPESPCDTSDGNDYFQGASSDGTRVYFTTTRQLVNADHDSGSDCSPVPGSSQGCDLYLYDSTQPAGDRLTLVSAGDSTDPTPGEGASVLSSIVALSGDGSHVYFVAQGILTQDPGPGGTVAQAGQPNLYAYDANSGHTAFIGTLGSTCLAVTDECHILWGNETSFSLAATAVPLRGRNQSGAEVGGDGHILVFQSRASLVPTDTDGGRRDIYRYDSSSATLQCLSCRGASDSEPFSVTEVARTGDEVPGPDFAERKRWVSEDGRTVVFSTGEPLVSTDVDGSPNPYLWQEGRLTQLPPSLSRNTPTLSGSGEQIAFVTAVPLVTADVDSAEDVYVARVEGGFPEPPPAAAPCQGESCLPPPVTNVATAALGTASFAGLGNAREGRKPGKRKTRGRRGKHKHAKKSHRTTTATAKGHDRRNAR